MKLAQALLLRKELSAKVDRLKQIDNSDLFEFRFERKAAAEGLDDIKAQVPRVTFQQLTHCYDWHARALREVDAVIQEANWAHEVIVRDDISPGYIDPYVKAEEKV